MPGQLRYELVGDASQFARAGQEVTNVAEKMEGSLSALEQNIAALTDGQIRLNEQVGRFRNESGQFVSSAEAQSAALNELNSEGVQTTEQIQQQVRRLEKLQEVYEGDAKASADLLKQQKRLRTELSEVGAAAAQQDQDLSRLDQRFGQATVQMTDFTSRQQRLQSELRSTAAAQERVADAGVTMRSSVSASANNLGFEFVQAAQDFQAAGTAGVVNQIPLMSEQFSQLTSRAGGTTGAIKALAGSFFGTAGIIGAVTLGAQALGPYINELVGASQAADDASEGITSATESVQGFTSAAQASTTFLENTNTLIKNLQQNAESLSDAGLSGALETLAATQGRPTSPLGGVTASETEFEQQKALKEVRSLLRQNTAQANVFESALQALDVDVDQILTGKLSNAREEVKANIDRFRDLEGTIRQALGEDRGVITESLGDQFTDLSERLQTEVERGLIEPSDAAQERIPFLEGALGELSDAGVNIQSAEFNQLFTFLEEWRSRLQEIKEAGDEASGSTTQVDSVGTFQRADNLEVVRDFFRRREQERPALGDLGPNYDLPTQQEIGRQLRQRRQLERQLGPSELDALVRRGTRQQIRRLPSQDEFTDRMIRARNAIADADDELQDGVNRSLTQGIQLASQLGATLIQGARQGGLEWNQVVGSILQSAGSIVGISNPAIGAGIAGAGTLIGAFQHGGEVDTPFQVVGEEGPEIAALPQGSQIYDHSTSVAMAESQAAQRRTSVDVSVDTSVERMGPGELALVVRESQEHAELHGVRRG